MIWSEASRAFAFLAMRWVHRACWLVGELLLGIGRQQGDDLLGQVQQFRVLLVDLRQVAAQLHQHVLLGHQGLDVLAGGFPALLDGGQVGLEITGRGGHVGVAVDEGVEALGEGLAAFVQLGEGRLVAQGRLLGGLGVALGQHLQAGGDLDVVGPVAHLDDVPDDQHAGEDQGDQQGEHHGRVALFRRDAVEQGDVLRVHTGPAVGETPDHRGHTLGEQPEDGADIHARFFHRHQSILSLRSIPGDRAEAAITVPLPGNPASSPAVPC